MDGTTQTTFGAIDELQLFQDERGFRWLKLSDSTARAWPPIEDAEGTVGQFGADDVVTVGI
jgi:hypothetical protein